MTETVRRAIISFSQLDQYIRCPLKYRFLYIDRVDPEWIPAALIFGRGIDNRAVRDHVARRRRGTVVKTVEFGQRLRNSVT